MRLGSRALAEAEAEPTRIIGAPGPRWRGVTLYLAGQPGPAAPPGGHPTAPARDGERAVAGWLGGRPAGRGNY